MASKDASSAFSNKLGRATVPLAISVVLVVVGVIAYIVQEVNGMGLTGMRTYASWGLGLVGFWFFEALSVGAMVLASGSVLVRSQRLAPMVPIMVWASLGCTCAAILSILTDLGGVLRAWELVASANLSSPLTHDVLVLPLYLILSCVTLVLMRHGMGERFERIWFAIMGAVAIAACFIGAWILSTLDRELWHSALLAPEYLVSSLMSGTGLVLLLAMALPKSVPGEDMSATLPILGKLAALFAAVFALMLLADAAQGDAASALVTGGVLSPLFWCCLAATAVVCLAGAVPALRTPPVLAFSAALAIIATFLDRLYVLVGGFQVNELGLVGSVTDNAFTYSGTGMGVAYQSLVYAPSLVEVGIFAGALGVALLVTFVGSRMFAGSQR